MADFGIHQIINITLTVDEIEKLLQDAKNKKTVDPKDTVFAILKKNDKTLFFHKPPLIEVPE